MRSRRAVIALLLASVATPLVAQLPVPLPPAMIATLVAAARGLFPDPGLDDAVYRRIVERAVAGASAEQSLAYAAAAAALAGPAGGIDDRIAAAFTLPGVQALRIAVLIGLYADPAVVRRYGYPGPSIEFGGYLDHGFGELPWLPEPAAAWLP